MPDSAGLPAKFLVSIDGANSLKPVLSMRTIIYPASAVWLELDLCNGDVLWVPYHRVILIIVKDPQMRLDAKHFKLSPEGAVVPE